MYSNIELLRHIKDEIDFVLSAVANKMAQVVFDDAVLSRAIVRSLEVIGEAAKKLDDDFKRVHAHIEWKKLAGTRDKLIHDYFGIDYDIVWDIVENKLPELQYAIATILDNSSGSSDGLSE